MDRVAGDRSDREAVSWSDLMAVIARVEAAAGDPHGS